MSDNNVLLNKKICVYHGSTSIFDSIDVEKGKPFKDFGRGFYVTESKEHAIKLALRNKRIEKERFGKSCEAYVYTYELDMSKLSNFNIKKFNIANHEWLLFVISNRKARDRTHNYDVVIGPTANDDTMVVINAYLDALYGEIGGDKALNILLDNIEADKLPGQIYFSRNEAANTMIQKEQVEKV